MRRQTGLSSTAGAVDHDCLADVATASFCDALNHVISYNGWDRREYEVLTERASLCIPGDILVRELALPLERPAWTARLPHEQYGGPAHACFHDHCEPEAAAKPDVRVGRNSRLRVPTRMGPASMFPRVSRQSTFGRAGRVQTRWGAHVVLVIGTIETVADAVARRSRCRTTVISC